MSSIIETAKQLIESSSKRELVVIARGYGWKGDDARAPILQLALYVAQQLQAGGDQSSGKADMQAEPQGESGNQQESGNESGNDSNGAQGAEADQQDGAQGA